MKLHEVPQDQDPSFVGGNKICYAVDADGKYVQAKTSGWNVEAEAKELAWKAIDAEVEATRVRVSRGEASPLEYFMKLRMMDERLLADNMGMFKWRVKWHLKPKKFRKLSAKLFQRYAECLDVEVEQLLGFTGQNKP